MASRNLLTHNPRLRNSWDRRGLAQCRRPGTTVLYAHLERLPSCSEDSESLSNTMFDRRCDMDQCELTRRDEGISLLTR